MARPLPIFRRSLARSGKGFLGWTLGILATLALYLPLFPTLASAELDVIIAQMPDELIAVLGYDEISSGAGYTEATFFGLIGFALFSIAAIGWGAGMIGGAEESGRLELELAHGVSRTRYALESAMSIVIRIIALAVVGGLIIAAFDGPAELELSMGNLVEASAALAGMSMVAGLTALLFGAWRGRKISGIAAGTGLTVAGYAFNALSLQVESLEWVRYLSTYAWAFGQPPLREGADPVGLLVLYGASGVLIVLTVIALRRRDVVG